MLRKTQGCIHLRDSYECNLALDIVIRAREGKDLTLFRTEMLQSG